MIERFNPKKKWFKSVTLLLSFVLCVNLMGGCSFKKENAVSVKKQDSQSGRILSTEGLEKEVSIETSRLAEKTLAIEELIGNLLNLLSEDELNQAKAVLVNLQQQLSQINTKTESWLQKSLKSESELSEKTQKLLKSRRENYEQQILSGKQKTDSIVEKIFNAIEANDAKTAAVHIANLRNLLVEEQSPKTYGDALPNETPQYKVQEEKYIKKTVDRVKHEQVLAENDSKKLLQTIEDTQLNDKIKQKTDELQTPLAVYNYLKNHIGTEYYYGSRKGAIGTYSALAGNDLDQASLLIAMLRYLGYEAEYVRGNIELTEKQALNLTGADTFEHAARVLVAAGTPITSLVQDGKIVRIRKEHVWVRAYLPYQNYRGAYKADGKYQWIDLDTSIKEYQNVKNIYDYSDIEDLKTQIQKLQESGDIEQLKDTLDEWIDKIANQNHSDTYGKKRVVKEKNVKYLPLSLQYFVESEKENFIQVPRKDKDSVSFSVNGEPIASFTVSELTGKNILLSFKAASKSDEEIIGEYNSIFKVPAYAVNMKPVLLVDGKVVGEGDELNASTLGAKNSFTIQMMISRNLE